MKVRIDRDLKYRDAVWAVAICLPLTLLTGCSSDDASPEAGGTSTTAVQVDPSALVDLEEVDVAAIPAGDGVANLSATASDARAPLPATYQEDEHLVEGTASLYAGPVTGPVTVESEDHPFTTRVVTRAPSDPDDFSGTVWVEPFNTSGGAEADVVWAMIAPLIESRGDAWIGVTVRAGQQDLLQAFDPVRYAGLDLAENGYAWDILREVGATLKSDEGGSLVAGGIEHVYLGGYSQSAVDSATFLTAFHDQTRAADGAAAYDGYLLGGRESNLSPLQSGDGLIPQFEHAPLPPVDVPVVNLESQTDVEGFSVEVPTAIAVQQGLEGAEDIDTDTFTYVNVGGAFSRRDDSDTAADRYRLYEVPGAPHAGNGDSCDGESTFPTSAFVRAAGDRLAHWAEDGTAPPSAPRIELATLDEVSVTQNDEDGNAQGGVRSPFVDVPLFTYAVHTGPGPTCILSGSETTLPPARLRERYTDADGYLTQFTESLDAAIDRGDLLELDREAMLATTTTNAEQAFEPEG